MLTAPASQESVYQLFPLTTEQDQELTRKAIEDALHLTGVAEYLEYYGWN